MTILTKLHGAITFLGIPVATYLVNKVIPVRWVRTLVGAAASTALIVLGTTGLPQGKVSTMMSISLSWMFAIRLTHLSSLTDEETANLTPFEFVKKFTWFALPISENPKPHRPRLTILKEELIPQAGIAATKFVVGSWISDFIFEELSRIQAASSTTQTGGELLAANDPARFTLFTFLFGGLVLTADYITSNLLPALCAFISGDRYQVMPFNDGVLCSNSPRVFWGLRYNRLVNSLLRDSVFKPLRQIGASANVAALSAFAVSGVLHLHVAKSTFGGGEIPALLFFLIHGALCTLDDKIGWSKGNKLVGWAANTGVLVVTLPLYLGLFIKACPAWMTNNPPSLRPPHWITLSAIRELIHH